MAIQPLDLGGVLSKRLKSITNTALQIAAETFKEKSEKYWPHSSLYSSEGFANWS